MLTWQSELVSNGSEAAYSELSQEVVASMYEHSKELAGRVTGIVYYGVRGARRDQPFRAGARPNSI